MLAQVNVFQVKVVIFGGLFQVPELCVDVRNHTIGVGVPGVLVHLLGNLQNPLQVADGLLELLLHPAGSCEPTFRPPLLDHVSLGARKHPCLLKVHERSCPLVHLQKPSAVPQGRRELAQPLLRGLRLACLLAPLANRLSFRGGCFILLGLLRPYLVAHLPLLVLWLGHRRPSCHRRVVHVRSVHNPRPRLLPQGYVDRPELIVQTLDLVLAVLRGDSSHKRPNERNSFRYPNDVDPVGGCAQGVRPLEALLGLRLALSPRPLDRILDLLLHFGIQALGVPLRGHPQLNQPLLLLHEKPLRA
mmetsp:Transcript_8678/g.29807  ORF Transcript_8678/g.29807 Transcript_8678/m.29807 type:complete len:302 (+) Transcript_8678:41-946(+)